MERTSKTDHEYGGRQLKPGDVFDVEPQHVELLLAIGRIEPVEGEPGYGEREPERPRAQRQRRRS
jgi:hypothetical protein